MVRTSHAGAFGDKKEAEIGEILLSVGFPYWSCLDGWVQVEHPFGMWLKGDGMPGIIQKVPHPHPWRLGHPSQVFPLMPQSWKSGRRECHLLWIRAGIMWDVPNPGRKIHWWERSNVPAGLSLLHSHENFQRDLGGISLQILGFKHIPGMIAEQGKSPTWQSSWTVILRESRFSQ